MSFFGRAPLGPAGELTTLPQTAYRLHELSGCFVAEKGGRGRKEGKRRREKKKKGYPSNKDRVYGPESPHWTRARGITLSTE